MARQAKSAKYGAPIVKLLMVREGKSQGSIRTLGDVLSVLEPLTQAPEEHFVSILLDSQHNVLGVVEISHGTLSASLVHPREVFKSALVANAYAILVAHNHPGGSMVASTDDIQTTKQLLAASEILGVPVLDHVIITPDRHVVSIRENYPTMWSKN